MTLITNGLNLNNTHSNIVDPLSDLLLVPTNKLDADQYAAEDLDGVTESIFGSGNMNFLSLQSGQANESLASLNPALSLDNQDISHSASLITPGLNPFTALDDSGSNNNSFDRNSSFGTDTDRPIVFGSDMDSNVSGDGNFTNTTVGAVSASALSFDNGSFSSIDGLNLFDGNDNSTNSATNIRNGDTVTNTIRIIEETVQDISNFSEELITNVFEGDITDITDIMNTATNEISELNESITNLLNELNVTDITNEITSPVTNIVKNTLTEILGNDRIALDLAGGPLETIGVDFNAVLENSIQGGLDVVSATDNLNTIVSDITGIQLPVIQDLGAVLDFDLLNPNAVSDNNNGDFDIAIADFDGTILDGLNLGNISLDAVESFVGDLDLTLTSPTTLLSSDGLQTVLEQSVNGLNQLDLDNISNTLDVINDQVLEGSFNLEIADTVLGDEFSITGEEVTQSPFSNILPEDSNDLDDVMESITSGFDTVETNTGDLDLLNQTGEFFEILGNDTDMLTNLVDSSISPIDLVADQIEGMVEDIDLNNDIFTDLLNNTASGQENTLDNSISGSDTDGWTDIIGNVGGMFDDIIASDNAHVTLSDPTGTIAEGLGVLNIPLQDGSQHGGLLGGLFG